MDLRSTGGKGRLNNEVNVESKGKVRSDIGNMMKVKEEKSNTEQKRATVTRDWERERNTPSRVFTETWVGEEAASSGTDSMGTQHSQNHRFTVLWSCVFCTHEDLFFFFFVLVGCMTSTVLPHWQSSPVCKVRLVPSHKQAERCHCALVTALVWPFQSRYSHSNC